MAQKTRKPRTQSQDAQFEQRLENDPRFLRRIEEARKSLRDGRAIRLEKLEIE
jgi:hypothetical protein